MANRAARSAKRGASPAQRAGAASQASETPVDDAENVAAPRTEGDAPDTLDGAVEGFEGESMSNVAVDAEGFPLGSIPYYIDDKRVTHAEYVEHLEAVAHDENLAELQRAAEGLTTEEE